MPERAVFLALLVLSLSPWASPPLALLAGIGFGLLLKHPYKNESKAATKWLLQASVVGLGFGMDLKQVLAAGGSGLLYTAAGIVLTMLAGQALARALGVQKTIAYLVSTGTAICGGSAIAAVGPIVGADSDEMSVSLATVFLLNSAALLIFPPIGHALGLSEPRFGLWAALAMHDTSSVVGASAAYGAAALAVGTTVKLARALWIVPLCLATAALRRSSAKIQWPWFIGLFVLAAAIRSYLPGSDAFAPLLYRAARAGLTATLFLIGSGISRESLRQVGPRPLMLGVLLWLLVGSVSLALIATGAIV